MIKAFLSPSLLGLIPRHLEVVSKMNLNVQNPAKQIHATGRGHDILPLVPDDGRRPQYGELGDDVDEKSMRRRCLRCNTFIESRSLELYLYLY